MRFDGSRENLDPSQVSVVDEELRWVDESGKEHRVPLVEDIVRHSKRVLSTGNRKTVGIRQTVGQVTTSSDFHILDVGNDQLIRIESITLVASDLSDFQPPEGSGVVLLDIDGNLQDILIELDGNTRLVDARSVEVDVSSGTYIIAIDYLNHIDADPDSGVESFDAYCSFNVWVEDE